MGVPVDDPLSKRAALMKESLQKSQTITDNMVSILGSFDHRLSALESAMRPTQVLSPISVIKVICFSLNSACSLEKVSVLVRNFDSF